jgi:hypothetical protein
MTMAHQAGNELGADWAYRPEPHDDWGIVRTAPDAEGRRWIVCQARFPYADEEALNEHRRNKTDPWEATARLIAAAPDLRKVLRRIVDNPEARIGGHIRAEAIAALRQAESPRQ